MFAVVPSTSPRHKKHRPTNEDSFEDSFSPLSIGSVDPNSEFSKFQAVLESQGGRWEGSVEAISLSGATLIIAGYPAMIQSQSLNLEIFTNGLSVELMGIVGRIRQKKDFNQPLVGCGVRIDINFKNLTDLVEHRLKEILRQLRTTSPSAFLHAKTIPDDHGHCIWEMRGCNNSSEFLPDLVSTDPVEVPHISTGHLQTNRSMRGKDHGQPFMAEQGGTSLRHLTSTLIELFNTKGQRIIGYHDHLQSSVPSNRPVVIVSPGYGETKREYIALAYYLAANGFHVVRYDHTNHVGESEGHHVNTSLSSMKHDLQAMIEYVSHHWPENRKVLVASSLGGRVALKAISEQTELDLLILLNPIVDVRRTLHAVHQEDLIDHYERGKKKGVTNVLGFNVELDHWLEDAVHGHYGELETTCEDASLTPVPTIVFSAEHDTWVQHASVTQVAARLGQNLQRWFCIPGGLHRVLENPQKARSVYKQLTHCCQRQFGASSSEGVMSEPSRKIIGLQNKVERDRKKVRVRPDELSQFWKDYLDSFHFIVNFGDYQALLDHIVKLMGPISSGSKILDAGCGNGNFGTFLFMQELFKSHQTGSSPQKTFDYVGTDFVATALHHARQSLDKVRKHDPFSRLHMNSALHCVDLNSPLPFPDGTFDKVVSNLVLGYVRDPEFTLQEFVRVLSPKGTLVLTNLKPNSDLSQIYSNFVGQTSQLSEIEEAKRLLNNSGKIREAEGDGTFHFQDQHELIDLLSKTSQGQRPKVFSTFLNQANIAVLEKRQSFHHHVSLASELPEAA